MAADDPAAGIFRPTIGRKDIMPDPESAGMRILAFQYKWSVDWSNFLSHLLHMDGFQRERLSETNREPFMHTQIGKPGPCQDARHSDHHLLTRGDDRLQQWLRTHLPIAVQQDLTILVEETDVPGASVEINATVILLLWGIESREVSSGSACGRRGPP
jgi:hypothetical protein